MSEAEEAWKSALQSQYSNSPRIKNIGRLFHEVIDSDEVVSFVNKNAVQIATASGICLDWWAERVGISRVVRDDKGEFDLSDDYLRKLIYIKAWANISNASAKSIAKVFTQFARTKVQVLDGACMSDDKTTRAGQVMTITIIFPANADRAALYLIRYYIMLIKGSGVWINYRIEDDAIFGFSNSGLETFNNGVFDYNSRDYE